MAASMKDLVAFLKNDPNPPKMVELKAFKEGCSPEEWQRYCDEAAEIAEGRG